MRAAGFRPSVLKTASFQGPKAPIVEPVAVHGRYRLKPIAIATAPFVVQTHLKKHQATAQSSCPSSGGESARLAWEAITGTGRAHIASLAWRASCTLVLKLG